jgi:hypothetical protein
MEHELEKINERLENIDLFQVGVRKSISIIQNQVVRDGLQLVYLLVSSYFWHEEIWDGMN